MNKTDTLKQVEEHILTCIYRLQTANKLLMAPIFSVDELTDASDLVSMLKTAGNTLTSARHKVTKIGVNAPQSCQDKAAEVELAMEKFGTPEKQTFI